MSTARKPNNSNRGTPPLSSPLFSFSFLHILSFKLAWSLGSNTHLSPVLPRTDKQGIADFSRLDLIVRSFKIQDPANVLAWSRFPTWLELGQLIQLCSQKGLKIRPSLLCCNFNCPSNLDALIHIYVLFWTSRPSEYEQYVGYWNGTHFHLLCLLQISNQKCLHNSRTNEKEESIGWLLPNCRLSDKF